LFVPEQPKGSSLVSFLEVFIFRALPPLFFCLDVRFFQPHFIHLPLPFFCFDVRFFQPLLPERSP
jgi:hypothetical protein